MADLFVEDNTVCTHDVNGNKYVAGTFSRHWAACAAMIRYSEPSFISLGGDRAEDVAEESRMRFRIENYL